MILMNTYAFYAIILRQWRKLQDMMNVRFFNSWSNIVREFILLKDGNKIWSIIRTCMWSLCLECVAREKC